MLGAEAGRVTKGRGFQRSDPAAVGLRGSEQMFVLPGVDTNLEKETVCPGSVLIWAIK